MHGVVPSLKELLISLVNCFGKGIRLPQVGLAFGWPDFGL
jgi:hypothetical protein